MSRIAGFEYISDHGLIKSSCRRIKIFNTTVLSSTSQSKVNNVLFCDGEHVSQIL